MTESYRALCSDFYVNSKLNLKMDLPKSRETVLDFFERVRKQYSSMTLFRRFRDELALEAGPGVAPHRWLALRGNNIRAGCVNPDELAEAYALHRLVLETAPYYLNISPLDVDYVEVLFGFDLAAGGNQDSIVFDALFAGSPMAHLMEGTHFNVSDCQPVLAFNTDSREHEIQFEVKTRADATALPREIDSSAHEPISVYLTLRRFGAVTEVAELVKIMASLVQQGEELVETKVVPQLLVPLRDAIASGNS